MNRDQKNSRTRRKIIDGALLEFSEKTYGEASLNEICANGNVSKGIIYHYFKDKDELYLCCVRECFDALTDYLKSAVIRLDAPIEAVLAEYFDRRIAFFELHPLYLKLFYGAVINPPAHLAAAMTEIKSEFCALNESMLKKALQAVRLRPDVSIGEVVDVFRDYQDFVNTRFQMQSFGQGALKEHEDRCRRSLQILLYGVIDREG